MDATTASTSCSSTASTRSSSPTGSASTTRGRSSTTSSRSTRTARRRRCSSAAASQRTEADPPRPRHHPAHDQPSGTRRRAGRRRSTSCRTGGSSSGSASRPRPPSSTRSTSGSATSARCGRTRCGACLPMFWNDAWEYHGEHFDFPLRNVIPKPRQKPHPPLWVACSQIETIRMAGRRGMGALGFQFVSAEAAQAWVHAYYNAFTKDQDLLCDHATNPNIAVVSQFMCAPTDEEARARADGSSFFQFALALLRQPPAGRAGRDQAVGRVRRLPRDAEGPGAAARRADRLAGHDPRASCASSRSRTSTR